MAKEARMFMRHKLKGTIYNYNEDVLRESGDSIEVVTEKEAFPERFEPKGLKGKKPKVNLKTDLPESDVDTR